MNGLYPYYQELKDHRIILVFKGALTQEILSELGSLVRLRFAEQAEHLVVRRLFAVLIEVAQNILHYSVDREYLPSLGREAGVGIVMVCDIDNTYEVRAGNMVTLGAGRKLAEKCEQINSLDREELKQLYLDTRRKEGAPDSKGAGLGLIDIARKSSQPLGCEIAPVDDVSAFFTLRVVIDKKYGTEPS